MNTGEARTDPEYSVVHEGVKAGKRLRKPPGFWQDPQTNEVLRAFVERKNSEEDAIKKLALGNDRIALRWHARRLAKRLGLLTS